MRNKQSIPPVSIIHGFTSRRGNHYLYGAWKGIKSRCLNPGTSGYAGYGGRGISLYNGWIKDPAAFIRWVLVNIGDRPSSTHTLDRINNDGNYEPGNLRWATKTQQCRNTRQNIYITVDGVRRLAIEVADERGLSRQAVIRRFHLGYPVEQILASHLKVGPR